MKKIINIRKIFVRQLGKNDCGLACLQIVMNYAGKSYAYSRTQLPMTMGGQGLSLRQLRDLAGEFGLKSRCVELDFEWMRQNSCPVILHMINHSGLNHFQVCFAASKKHDGFVYLMADPARQVYCISEQELNEQWPTKAALYFEDLPESKTTLFTFSWNALLSMNLFPRGLWFSLPLLNLCTAGLGIAISWVLQRGMEYPIADRKQSFIDAVVLLLFIITLFKSILSYLRQRILITLNRSVNEQLVHPFIAKVAEWPASNGVAEDAVTRVMPDIQKIQNAVAVFVSVLLSDGSLVVLLLSAAFYAAPAVGYINLAYLLLVNFLALKSLPELSFSYAHLNELLGSTDIQQIRALQNNGDNSSGNASANHFEIHKKNHNRYHIYARSLAIKISKMNFRYECIGTVNVIIVFVYGMVQLQHKDIPYSSFMLLVIISYFISAIMPKIVNAIWLITEGAEAARQYQFVVNAVP